MSLIKRAADTVKGIVTQMYNPFWWAAQKKINFAALESKVPGAVERIKKGEVIPEYEYVTEGKLGWEYRQVLAGNEDPWCMSAVKYPRSNHARPHVVYTLEDHRIVACVDCMEDQHYVNYMYIRPNEMGRCRDCGNCVVCLAHPEPQLFYQDAHH